VSTDELKAGLRSKRRKQSPENGLLSTGSTLLNLACTGRVEGGFLKGHYYFFVGDSDSGKTWLSLTCFAEACLNPAFLGYRLIYDAVEGGALMNIEHYFGKRVAERMEPPEVDDGGEAVNSDTAESFYYHVADALDFGKPFVYVLDSQDSLSSDAEVDKFEKHRKAYRGGKDAAGSYGDNKAKLHSSKLRRLMGPLQETGSILLILNQTRDSFSMFEPATYSGGRALKFYATLQLWSRRVGAITKTYRKKERQLGIVAQVRVKKNRVTGRDRSVKIPIYHSFGIDDVGSCVDYLISEGRWAKTKGGVITVKDLGPSWTGKHNEVVSRIEEDGMEEDVVSLVGETWQDIERACIVSRKSRYSGQS